MDTFKLKVVGSRRIFFEGEVKSLILPIADGGLMGFLAHHANVVAPIEYGEDNKDDEDGIKDQDYSLNAGRYVGVVIEDDGMTEAEFKDTMLGLNKKFEDMNAEAKTLEAQIAANIKALFGE